MNQRDKLLSLLKEKSYQKKQVVLSSGKTSDFYVDIRQTALHSEGATLIGALLWERLSSAGPSVQAIGGMTLGADPLVVATSIQSFSSQQPIAAFIIRKEPKGHGTAQWIEGTANLKKGMNVAIVDDVATTGGSTLKSVERAKAWGLNVVRILCVVDRQEGASEAIQQAGYTLESLFVKKDFEV